MRAIAGFGLALIGSTAFAQEGMYVGAGYGSFDYEEDLRSAGSPFDRFSDSVGSWKLYGGFEFTDHFGIEFSYGATSELETSGRLGFGMLVFDTAATVDFTTTSVKGMGFLPFEWGTLIGGLGWFDTESEIEVALLQGGVPLSSTSVSVGDNGLTALLGLEWRFGRPLGTNVGVRLEYEWLDLDAADGSTIGIGAAYRF